LCAAQKLNTSCYSTGRRSPHRFRALVYSVAPTRGPVYRRLGFPCHHTHTQPFNGPWSSTTRVGRYQKKHSPTDARPDHRTSFINFLHLPAIRHLMTDIRRVKRCIIIIIIIIHSSLCVQFTCLTVLFDNQSINQSIKTLIHVDRPQRDKVHMVKITHTCNW